MPVGSTTPSDHGRGLAVEAGSATTTSSSGTTSLKGAPVDPVAKQVEEMSNRRTAALLSAIASPSPYVLQSVGQVITSGNAGTTRSSPHHHRHRRRRSSSASTFVSSSDNRKRRKRGHRDPSAAAGASSTATFTNTPPRRSTNVVSGTSDDPEGDDDGGHIRGSSSTTTAVLPRLRPVPSSRPLNVVESGAGGTASVNIFGSAREAAVYAVPPLRQGGLPSMSASSTSALPPHPPKRTAAVPTGAWQPPTIHAGIPPLRVHRCVTGSGMEESVFLGCGAQHPIQAESGPIAPPQAVHAISPSSLTQLPPPFSTHAPVASVPRVSKQQQQQILAGGVGGVEREVDEDGVGFLGSTNGGKWSSHPSSYGYVFAITLKHMDRAGSIMGAMGFGAAVLSVLSCVVPLYRFEAGVLFPSPPSSGTDEARVWTRLLFSSPEGLLLRMYLAAFPPFFFFLSVLILMTVFVRLSLRRSKQFWRRHSKAEGRTAVELLEHALRDYRTKWKLDVKAKKLNAEIADDRKGRGDRERLAAAAKEEAISTQEHSLGSMGNSNIKDGLDDDAGNHSVEEDREVEALNELFNFLAFKRKRRQEGRAFTDGRRATPPASLAHRPSLWAGGAGALSSSSSPVAPNRRHLASSPPPPLLTLPGVEPPLTPHDSTHLPYSLPNNRGDLETDTVTRGSGGGRSRSSRRRNNKGNRQYSVTPGAWGRWAANGDRSIAGAGVISTSSPSERDSDSGDIDALYHLLCDYEHADYPYYMSRYWTIGEGLWRMHPSYLPRKPAFSIYSLQSAAGSNSSRGGSSSHLSSIYREGLLSLLLQPRVWCILLTLVLSIVELAVIPDKSPLHPLFLPARAPSTNGGAASVIEYYLQQQRSASTPRSSFESFLLASSILRLLAFAVSTTMDFLHTT